MDGVRFADRAHAGRLLAAKAAKLNPERPVVYALPRGGVPVAAPIAEKLGAPLDVLLVRKIGVPWRPELAAGSIVDGERPDVIWNEDVVAAAELSAGELETLAARELEEIERRRALYLHGAAPIPSRDRSAILVDDGIATGASMRAAIAAMRRRAPKAVILAVPVAARDTVMELKAEVDHVICLAAPARFGAVGFFYDDFHQLSDQEVIALLERSRRAPAAAQAPAGEA